MKEERPEQKKQLVDFKFGPKWKKNNNIRHANLRTPPLYPNSWCSYGVNFTTKLVQEYKCSYLYIYGLFLISFQKIFWFSFKFFLTIFCFSSSCRGSNSSISVPFQLKNNRELNKLCIYQGVVVKFTMWVGVWELIQFRGQLTQAN